MITQHLRECMFASLYVHPPFKRNSHTQTHVVIFLFEIVLVFTKYNNIKQQTT